MAPRPLTWPGKRSKQPSLRQGRPLRLEPFKPPEAGFGPSQRAFQQRTYRQPSPRRGRVGTAAGAWRGNAAPPFFGAAAANRPASRAQIHFVGARRTGVERARPFSGRPTRGQGEWGPDATDGLQCRRPKRCGGILYIRWEFRSDAPKPIRLRGGGIGNHRPFLWRFFQFPFYDS